nr:hypothetical protein [Tanacetum cinerariifolium]
MGDEHLSTIPETESDEVRKSSVKNLVPIRSESEDTSDNESECDVPINDESYPIFTTFSNPLFDCNNNFNSSDDKSLSNEDVSMDNFKIYSNSPFDDEEIISTKIEEADFDLEEEIRLVENLLYDNSSQRPLDSHMEEIDLFLATVDLMPPSIKNDDYDSEGDINFLEELLSNDLFSLMKTSVLTTKVVKGISEHYVLMPNILPTLSTLDPDLDFTPSHDSIGSGNKIFNLGIFIEVQSERLLSREKFSISIIRDPLYPVFDSLLPFSSKNKDKVFKPDLEDSRAHGFIHRQLEFQSFAYGNRIS